MELLDGLAGGISPMVDGGEDPKKKKKSVYSMDDEMKQLYKKNLKFDNKAARDVVLSAAKRGGVDPSILFSSSFGEGLNKAIVKPDEVSEAYVNAEKQGLDTKNYPVDGFYNYGVDRFGDNYERLKKYLPEGFDKEFTSYKAKNEKNEDIRTAAFKSNEAALVAKSAMLRDAMDQVDAYAKKKGIKIEDADKNYFTLAGYNGGMGNAQIMLDEYAKAKDKKEFIEKGLTSRQGVHKNISPRLSNMKLSKQLLEEKDQEPAIMSAPSALVTK